MSTCTCGKTVPGSQLCLVLYDVVEAEKKTTKALGAIETASCERCLAQEAWKWVGRDLLTFLLGIVVISVLAALIGRVFQLAWFGGGILILGLLAGLVKNLAGALKRTARNGAALRAQAEYRKQGYLPRKDLLFVTETGDALFRGDRIPQENKAGVVFLTVAAAEDALHNAAPDSEETRGLRDAIDRARRLGSPDVLPDLPGIRRAFYFPVAAGFLLLLAGAVAVLCLLDVTDTLSAGQTSVAVLEGLIAVVAFGGAMGMVLRRKPVWYVPLMLAAALCWVLALRWGEDLRSHWDEPLILSLSIVIPALCFLPWALRDRRKQDEPE